MIRAIRSLHADRSKTILDSPNSHEQPAVSTVRERLLQALPADERVARKSAHKTVLFEPGEIIEFGLLSARLGQCTR
jgi:hypothetical protein